MNYPLYRNELCSDLWDKSDGEGYSLKREVKEALVKIASDFVTEYLREASITMTIKDVIMVGSTTNYNWTKYSDIDLHVIVDYKELDMSTEDAGTLLTAIKINWNKSHNITIKGHDVELYVQDAAQPAESVSVYSIQNDKWIKPPQKINPKFDKKTIIEKHKKWKTKIDSLLENPDEAVLRKTLERLYDFRQAGLDSKAGEFSAENVVFKILRAQGYLDKIKHCAVSIYDKEMTITEKIDLLEKECGYLLSESASTEVNQLTMYRGARNGNPKEVDGPSYFCSAESFAKTYGATAAFRLNVKNPLIVSDADWRQYANSAFNPIRDVVKLVRSSGHDSVINIRNLPNGNKFYTALVLDPRNVTLVS